MTEPIRLLHFADVHIGVENYGRIDSDTGISARVLDFLNRLDEVIGFAETNDVDIAICAGDIFQTRTPTPTYQREFAHRLRRLASLCPVVLLVGNHDQPTMLKKATSIDIYSTLDVPNVTVGKRYGIHQIETKRGPVQVATAPYPNRGRLLAEQNTGGMSITEVDALLQSQLELIINDMAAEVGARDAPRVLVGHFTVTSATWGSERQIMLGRDAVVGTGTLATPAWDYVALGHIHRHQNLTKGQEGVPPVVYAGSLERVDFGEEGDDKGFCWVELARGATTWDFVKVDARPFKTLRVDLRESDDPNIDLLAALDDVELDEHIVRLILSITPENEALLRERDLRSVLRKKAYYIASVQRQVERPARTRWEGEAPEMLTPIELLAHYLDANETPDARKKVLLDYAERLFGEGTS